jgi:hypothetical protein
VLTSLPLARTAFANFLLIFSLSLGNALRVNLIIFGGTGSSNRRSWIAATMANSRKAGHRHLGLSCFSSDPSFRKLIILVQRCTIFLTLPRGGVACNKAEHFFAVELAEAPSIFFPSRSILRSQDVLEQLIFFLPIRTTPKFHQATRFACLIKNKVSRIHSSSEIVMAVASKPMVSQPSLFSKTRTTAASTRITEKESAGSHVISLAFQFTLLFVSFCLASCSLLPLPNFGKSSALASPG